MQNLYSHQNNDEIKRDKSIFEANTVEAKTYKSA